MKRPLFRAAALFALGEVTGIYADDFCKPGIIFIMLGFCALFLVRILKRIGFRGFVILFLFFMAGFANVILRDIEKNMPESMHLDGYGTVFRLEDNIDNSNIYVRTDYGFNVVVFNAEYEGRTYSYGDRVYLSGELREFSHNQNPGCFDFRKYYKAKGVLFSMDKESVMSVSKSKSPGYSYLNSLHEIRKEMISRLYKITDEKTAGIYSGILFGDRKAVDSETRLDYQNNGIAHILAISGLHISLIFSLVFKLLRKTGINRYAAGVSTLFLIFSYAFMTGFGMSTLRALCMIIISLAAIYTGEYYDMQTALSVALFVILLYNPFKLTDDSVVLSVTAMAGVCTGRYVLKHLDYFYYINTFRKKIFAALIISASVNLVMLPFVIGIYHEITPYGILINLPVIPLMTIVAAAGIFASLISYVSFFVASLAIKPGEAVLRFYELICRLSYRLPCGRINIGRINIYQILAYYLMLFLLLAALNKKITERIRKSIYKRYHIWLSNRKRMLVVIIYVLAVSVIFSGGLAASYLLTRREFGIFIFVGQGDGALIRTDSGLNLVVDGGSTTEKQLGSYTLIPVIKYYGMAHVDYWFISHTDTDHISGLIYILELGERSGITVDNLVFSYAMEDEDNCKRLVSLAKKNKIKVIYMKAGDYISGEGAKLTCVHPDSGYKSDDINDSSLCLSFSLNDMDILFTGDVGNEAMEYMLRNEKQYLLPHYDILKVPHHGSRNSALYSFYQSIQIENAVISCAPNSIYGHPHKELLDLLESFGITIRRTDLEGGVVFK